MDTATFHHPYDTTLSAGLRFFTELIAWTAGPWAVALWSKWFVLPAVLILVGLPAVFSTLKDKNNVIIPTPGPVRLVIELLLFSVATVAPWYVWSPIVAGVAVGIVVLATGTGVPRMLWLLKGAP